MILIAGADEMTDDELARAYVDSGVAEDVDDALAWVDVARGRLSEPVD